MKKLNQEARSFWQELSSGKVAQMIKEEAPGQKINNSAELYNVMRPLFEVEDDIEKMYLLFLTTKNRIISIEALFSGTINGAHVYPRELIKRVLATKAAAVIIAHNHPSGDPSPSKEDMQITLRIATALQAISVSLHEHIIVGKTSYCSMADDGLITEIVNKVTAFFNQ